MIIVRKTFRLLYLFLVKSRELMKLPFEKKYWKGESYYPEFIERKKSLLEVFIDQCNNIIKYGFPNQFYFLYGLDIKNLNNMDDFVDNTLFMRQRSVMNHRFMEFPPISILRDKSLFGIVAKAYGIYTPKNIGVIQNRKLFLYEEKTILPIKEWINSSSDLNNNDFFIKPIDGECGDGIYHVVKKDGAIFFKDKPIDTDTFFENNKRYLLQESIINQHPAIKTIHPLAINTLRLVTVCDEKSQNIEVFSCVLRVGIGNHNVDNWAMGGVSIGVDTDKGVLRKFGFFKPGFGTKVTEHPDSHIVFDGYKIPYLNEAINQAKEFHSYLYGIHSIGWDIAITENGPCFVEGNDNWEISLMQISNHGLKKEFNQYFY